MVTIASELLNSGTKAPPVNTNSDFSSSFLDSRFSGSADQLNAQISREQYNDYLNRFAPLEEQYINNILNDKEFEEGVNDAGRRVNKGFEISKEVTDRDIERLGLNISPGQLKTLSRIRRFGNAQSFANAKNTSRSAYSDIRLEALQNLTGFGRDLATSASSSAGNAAALETQRQNINSQLSAQSSANNLQLLGTAVGLGISLFASSENYKENIKPVRDDRMHDLLMDVEVVEFDYKDDAPVEQSFKDEHYLGVISEQVPEIFRSGKGDTVNMINLVGALIASNKHLSNRIATLEGAV